MESSPSRLEPTVAEVTEREVPMTVQAAWREPCYSHRLVRPFIAYLRSRGAASESLDALADHDTDDRLPIRDLLQHLDRLVERTGDADVGLRAAQAMAKGGTGVTHFAAASAPTVGEALRVLVRYAALVNEAAQFELLVGPTHAEYVLRSRVALNRPAADFQLAVLVFRLRVWLGSTAGIEAQLRHGEPADTRAYAEVLPGVAVRFHAGWDGVRIDAALLDRPMPSADPELHAVMIKHADELLARLPDVHSLSQRVRDTVLMLMREGELDGRRVAVKLGMSRRSLTRHLEQEQTSYSELLNEVRRAHALELLSRTDLDVQEIAGRLGYSLTAAFSRAFRRWEGMSPVQYRRSCGSPGRSSAQGQRPAPAVALITAGGSAPGPWRNR
jgi:AraC-like DNA-binding protein